MKKRSNKVLLLTGLATVTIGAAGILHTNYMQQPPIGLAKPQTYNYHPNNILDNVFEQDNVTYLPFIFESPDQKITKEFITSEFAKKGLTITSQLNAVVGTGTEITVKENNTVYTVVVYGDVNGNGEVNLVDAQLLILHYRKTQTITKKANLMAGNVSNDNGNSVINLVDAQRVIMFKNKSNNLDKLVVVEPTSNKETDKTAPVITILGQSQVTLEEGDSYTDQGATAKDNYDGDVTAEISIIIQFVANGSSQIQTVEQVDTSKIGTYTITYKVSDSNGNTATAARTVVIKEKEIVIPPEAEVESIELVLADSFKTEYQYREATTLNLTGAQINVKTDDGNTTPMNVNTGMLSTYDLTTAGEKEISVTYKGKTAEKMIHVTVLKPISGLIMNSTGNSNVQEIENGYQTKSKEDFVLGTIQAEEQEGGSTLQASQLKIEKTVTTTTDSTTTVDDLTIELETDESGNILVKGKAEKVGEYTINVSVYDGNDKVEKAIKLTVQKSEVIKEVKVEPTEENEIIKVGKVAIRKLTVINNHDEELDLTSANITISPIEDVTIYKLDADKKIIPEGDTVKKVEYLQIGTTIETERTEVTANMTMLNGQASNFKFSISAKSILKSFTIEEDVLNVYTTLPSNSTNVRPGVGEQRGNIYTLIEPTFLDQYEQEMPVVADDIFGSINEADVTDEASRNKLGILLPKSNISIYVPDYPDLGLMPHPDLTSVIDMQCFNEAGEVTIGENEITKIGFSIILNDAERVVNLEKLDGKEVVFKCGNTTKSLTIKVNYRELTRFSINTTSATIETDEDDNYKAKLNEKFTLGVITQVTGETPITPDMLTTDVTLGDKTGINISYELDETSGNILVKGTVTKEGLYQITPKVGDIASTLKPSIKGIIIPTIEEIRLQDFDLQIGDEITKEFIVTSDVNPNGQPVKAKEIIDIKQTDATTNEPIDVLDIRLRDSSGDIENEQGTILDKIVKSIKFIAKDTNTVDKEVNVTIKILLEGQTKEESKTIKVSVYRPIPRKVEISDAINLYDTHTEDVTVQENGLVYTLLPIKLFANNEKTRELPANAGMFVYTEIEKQDDKVYIVQPKVMTSIEVEGGDPMEYMEQPVLDIKYFKEASGGITSGEGVNYIGIAFRKIEGLTYNQSDLNGKEIKLICGDATEALPSATVTIHYTP